MRRIVTAREQYALRQHWADVENFVGTAGGDPTACDPATEDCSGSASKEKADTADLPRSDAQNNAPTQGSNAEGFYDQKPTPSVSDGVYRTPSSGGSSGSGSGASPNVPYSPDAGVEQWRKTVEVGLQRNGLPLDLADNVLHQMQTESSGNPNAQNNWDSNAQKGTPSGGLLQTIGPTYDSYKLPGAGNDMFNPQDNVDAAINYAKERYGPTLMNDEGQGMGSGHGY